MLHSLENDCGVILNMYMNCSIASVYIHHHASGLVSKGFLQLIRSSISRNHATFFVTTSSLNDYYKNILTSLGVFILERENIGYDFASLLSIRSKINALPSINRIVVLNSSMLNISSYGFGHDKILDQLASSSDDLLSITSSLERFGFHIQTYHYSISSRFFFSSAFDKLASSYLGSLRDVDDHREYAICNGEAMLAYTAVTNGFSTNQIFPFHRLFHINNIKKLKRIQDRLNNLIQPLLFADCPEGVDPSSFLFHEFLPKKTGMADYNPALMSWLILLLNNYYFIKRELLLPQDDRFIQRVFSINHYFYTIISLLNFKHVDELDLSDLQSWF